MGRTVGQIGNNIFHVNQADVGEIPDFANHPPAWTNLYYGMSDSDSDNSYSLLRDDYPWYDRYDGFGPIDILLSAREMGLLGETFECTDGAEKGFREYLIYTLVCISLTLLNSPDMECQCLGTKLPPIWLNRIIASSLDV